MTRPPRMRVGPNETYAEARKRFRVKLAEWVDYQAMCYFLGSNPLHTTKQRHFLRAFYRVELHYVAEVLL